MTYPTPEVPTEYPIQRSRLRVREHIGWLIWCMDQGYVKAEDRAVIGANWLLEDEATLSDDDLDTKRDLLVMADEVLAALG